MFNLVGKGEDSWFKNYKNSLVAIDDCINNFKKKSIVELRSGGHCNCKAGQKNLSRGQFGHFIHYTVAKWLNIACSVLVNNIATWVCLLSLFICTAQHA